MLLHIHIRNYAIISEADLTFSTHFSIITGETGAGKSILLGALGLLVGNRADYGVLSDPEQKCVVEGKFDIARFGFQALFAEEDVDYEPVTLIRREVLPGGKSRAFVNDTPVSLAFLKKLGEKLVDIHSQHQTLSLRDEDYQLEMLDGFAENTAALQQYRQTYQYWKALEKEIHMLEEGETRQNQEIEFKQYLFNELAEAGLEPGELTRCEDELKILGHADEIKAQLTLSINAFNEGDESILNQLNSIKSSLSRLATVGGEMEEVYNRLQQSLEELKDLERSMVRLENATENDPERLALVSARVDVLQQLLQKHKVQSVEDLIAIREQLETELLAYSHSGERLEQLRKEAEQKQADVRSQAHQISQVRQQAAGVLGKSIHALLAELEMPEAVFEITVEALPEPNIQGMNTVFFRFSANKGLPPQDLGKIASGGEISRLMLALKSVVSSKKNLPTIIFDEIDTGVSGLVADKVGNALAKMAARIQVIAITHLPQIAGKGDFHLKVMKDHGGSRTQSVILKLAPDERVDELAKMLSGAEVTPEARENARVLLGMK